MKRNLAFGLVGTVFLTFGQVHGQTADGASVPVSPDNFVRAETDRYFAVAIEHAGGIGKFHHDRNHAPVDKQIVVRGNLDTLYSTGVWDLDAGPLTVTLPDAGRRFRSLIVISEDQYTPAVHYKAGDYTFTREQIGTRYILLGIRTLVDPNDPKDVAAAHALQDATRTSQASVGTFEVPNWDPVSQKKVRDALVVLYTTLPDQNRMFGTKEQVDPVRRLIGAAGGWGGNPEREATYMNVTPARNDGTTVYKLDVKDVPVDGFWQRLQRGGLFSRQSVRRLRRQQCHGEEGCGRLGRRPVRRLRRQDTQLPADRRRLELSGAPVSPPSRDSGRHMEVSGSGAGQLSLR
ncbi:DUF1254 domain-containing protein [Bradyrhizobium stylosanthis]|uniref:DUF1254 domain-containing protein n=1 Tax=Bradyrhizobium stylosanthis TaxID=1803665 RepID=UPI000B28A8F2